MTSAITGRIKPRIEIAPGADPAGDPSLWPAFVDAGKRRAKVDIVITAGRDDEASEVEAGSFNATMDNRDGRLSPRNPYGIYYGDLSRGTPIRTVFDRVADNFTRTVASGWGSTPEGFAWNVTNGTAAVDGSSATIALAVNNACRNTVVNAGSPDAEVVWSTTLPVMPTGAAFVSAALFRHTDSANYIRAHVEFQAAGTIAVKVQQVYKGAQTDLLALTPTSVTYSAGTKVWGKARADGPYVLVKAWTGNLSDEPDTWQGVASNSSVEGVGTGWFGWRINTNVGTFTAKIDDFALTNILWSGNVPEWSPKWPEKSGTDSTVPVVGAGIIRRLSQGSSPVNSPLLNHLSAQRPFTYYPCEDESGAQHLTSVSGDIATTSFITFAADDTLPGSAPTVQLDGSSSIGQIQFPIKSTVTPDGFAALWFFKLDALPSILTNMVFMRTSGTMRTWNLNVDATNISWTASDSSGATIASGGSAWAVDPTQWIAMQLETNVAGGNVDVTLLWHQIGTPDYFFTTDNYAGTSTKPDYFSIIPASNTMSVAHLWFGDNDLPFVDGTFTLVADGYFSETAAARVARLCGENNVPVYVLAGDSEPMGRQKTGKLVDLLRECEQADHGILCERGNALMFIPRTRRYNMPVALALDWAAGDLSEAPEPTDDDQRLRNKWKVSRVDGSSVTVRDAASIAKTGTIDDSATLNIAYDGRLIDFANWMLSESTADFLRWPRVTIDLIAHPEFIPLWLACRIGSRITIANPPQAQLAGQVVDLTIEGYTQTLNNYKWIVELACSPAEIYTVGEWDSASSKWDAATALITNNGPANWTAIKLGTRKVRWSTTAVPYDLKLGSGEVVTVTAMGAVGHGAQLIAGNFETTANVAQWGIRADCTFVQSATFAHGGSFSGLLTVTGTPVNSYVRPSVGNFPHVVPGTEYTLSLWLRSTALIADVRATIDWYDEDFGYLSNVDSGSASLASGSWVQRSVSGVPPEGAAYAVYGPTIVGSPAAGTLLYVDDVLIQTDQNTAIQDATVTRAVNTIAKALESGDTVHAKLAGKWAL